MEYVQRKISLLTNEPTLEHLYTLPQFPVFIGCTDEPADTDVRADMEFDICTKTGFIQLSKLLPLDVIYSQYHSEAVGGVWKAHHEELAKFIAGFYPKEVLELGGSNGSLARLVHELKPEISWTMVEPNPPEKLEDEKVKLIIGYFDEQFKPQIVPDVIVHSHVLEHLYDPRVALQRMSEILPVGGRQIFSIPNLYKWLQNKFPNALNFEHTMFLTETVADYLLSTYGFKVIKKEYFQEHSIFYAAEKSDSMEKLPLPNCYAEYKKLYMDFVRYHEQEVASLNEKIKNFSGNVYLFGAHIFSQALLQFGLKENSIAGILDNSKIKQGKRLYGSNLKVMGPENVAGGGDVAVILRAGAYTKEITEQLLGLNPKTVIF